ncbi:MAG: hypothetical protein AAF533_17805 [Acidobacteriota bacterium]
MSFEHGELCRELHFARTRSLRDPEREQAIEARLDVIEARHREVERRCPECREPMVDMGLDFRPPKMNDVKAWRIIEGRHRIGHAFHTCGCNETGPVPRTLVDYRAYLEERRRGYADELRAVQQEEEDDPEQRIRRSQYWSERIEAVEAVLSELD